MSARYVGLLDQEIYLHAIVGIRLVVSAVKEQLVPGGDEHLCHDVLYQHSLVCLQFAEL